MATNALSCSLQVSNPRILLTQTVNNPFNELDAFGLFLSLERNVGESNLSYKDRLLDVMNRKPGCHYLGLLYHLTRRFNLSLFYPLRITRNSSDANIYYKFSGGYFKIYDGESVLHSYECFNPVSPNYYLHSFVSNVNSDQDLFTLEFLSEGLIRTETIVNHTSLSLPKSKLVQTGIKRILVDKDPITRVSFNSTFYNQEKNTIEELTTRGSYSIQGGTLVVAESAPSSILINYQVSPNEVRPPASPIIINGLNDECFIDRFTEDPFLPTVGILNLLLQDVPSTIGA